MRVYVDQLECTGSGQCEMLAPEVFVLGDDGLATVKDVEGNPVPDGAVGVGVAVPFEIEAKVRDAADVCPGACIYCVDERGTASASVPHHIAPPEPGPEPVLGSEPAPNH